MIFCLNQSTAAIICAFRVQQIRGQSRHLIASDMDYSPWHLLLTQACSAGQSELARQPMAQKPSLHVWPLGQAVLARQGSRQRFRTHRSPLAHSLVWEHTAVGDGRR